MPSYGPITVHWLEPNPPHDPLPCFAPITRAEFDKLDMDLRRVLFDPCEFAHIDSLKAELGDKKSRRQRYAEIKELRAYKAAEREAKGVRK